MQKKILRKMGTWFLLMVFCCGVLCQSTLVAEAATPSEKDYTVLLNGSRYFIHNEKTVGSDIGTEYYMTYTVKRATVLPTQFGLVGTADYTRNFPHDKGGLMRFIGEEEGTLLDEGYTYFIRFEVAKGGFIYNVTRAKGDKLEDMYMDKIFGEATDEMKYFGIWAAYDKVDVELTDVRFYDAKGNDLGVKYETPTKTGLVTEGNLTLQKDTAVDHRYEVTIESAKNIAVSNLRVPTTDRFYMEYKVESAEYMLNQEGFALSNDPASDYPHRNAILKHVTYPEITNSIDFLDEGAEYIITINREADAYNVLVQKTKDGVTTHTLLSNASGTYSTDFDFASLWFGAGGDTNATFKLLHVKVYDEYKNNLGVQTNVTSNIMHYGEMEDYAGCEAAYYCEETDSFMALYKDQTMKHTTDNTTEDATYKISENVMKALFAAGEKTYDYLYRRITDENQNEYDRLYHYSLTFVTGTDAQIDAQELSNEKGYLAMKPTDPTMKGYEFQGWYTSDGEEYDFEKIVTKSDILYAKWSGDGGVSFLAGEEPTQAAPTTYLMAGAGAALVLAGAVVCVLFIRKGLKNENR